MFDKLVAKADNINTSGVLKKTDYNTKITELKIKLLIVIVLLKRLITILKLLK